MRVRILKRSIVTKNLIIYVGLSIFYLHTIESLGRGRSALDIEALKLALISYKYLIGLMFIVLISVFKAYKVTKYLLPIFFSYIIFECTSIFFVNFDKFILILNFIYILMSFYFLIFWFLELRESSYWPNYSHNTIGKKSLYNLPVEIELSNQLNISGRLTNWDENSCFIALDSSIEARNESVSIKVEYENREFVNIGEIVSSYDSGIGVRLDSQQRPLSFSWNDFYLVIKERGLAPYYLKG